MEKEQPLQRSLLATVERDHLMYAHMYEHINPENNKAEKYSLVARKKIKGSYEVGEQIHISGATIEEVLNQI